ncbi:MAG TPA: c-type cytochrome [Vicinamibacteria bacterium]|nr:c-type cytochrome [Vicinamibacteria bacterium]
MWRFGSIGCLLLAGALASGDTPAAQAPSPPQKGSEAQTPDAGIGAVSGSYAYRTHCASCHGADGKGDGPMAENLRFRPPDLTLIAKRNRGQFPADKVFRIVDGRNPLRGHGGSDMPIWGDAFKNADTGYDDAKVKEKVRTLVDYLRTLQVQGK